MSHTILLARPHAFIVGEMKPFLEQGGFAVTALSTVANLPTAVAGTCGAVISLALTSSIPESAEAAGISARLVGVDSAPDTGTPLGQPDTFLYFSKDDLAQPQRKASALKLIQRHFCQT